MGGQVRQASRSLGEAVASRDAGVDPEGVGTGFHFVRRLPGGPTSLNAIVWRLFSFVRVVAGSRGEVAR